MRDMCKQFGCLPSALMNEDAEFLRMLRLAAEDEEDEEE